MERRKFLLTTGSVICSLSAGCIEQGEQNQMVSLGELVNEDVTDFTISSFDVQQSVLYRGTAHPRIRNLKDKQYLVFGVDIEQEVSRSKMYDRFFISDGSSIKEELERKRLPTKNRDKFTRDMYLLYKVPRDNSVLKESLLFEGLEERYEWSINKLAKSTDLIKYMENPPSPTVKSFDVPSSIDPKTNDATVTVTVSDTSNTEYEVREPMKLLLGSTKTSGRQAFTAPVKAGEVQTHRFSVPVYPDVGPNTETIRLSDGHDTITEKVPIEE
jgi:hypothetical protein